MSNQPIPRFRLRCNNCGSENIGAEDWRGYSDWTGAYGCAEISCRDCKEWSQFLPADRPWDSAFDEGPAPAPQPIRGFTVQCTACGAEDARYVDVLDDDAPEHEQGSLICNVCGSSTVIDSWFERRSEVNWR